MGRSIATHPPALAADTARAASPPPLAALASQVARPRRRHSVISVAPLHGRDALLLRARAARRRRLGRRLGLFARLAAAARDATRQGASEAQVGVSE